MKATRKEYIDQSMPCMITDLKTIISCVSVWDPDTVSAEAPFGSGPAKALRMVLAMAEKMGFTTRNFNGYAGDITLGTGKKMTGILAHIDVVAAETGWNTDPFDAVIKDGNIYGRGTSDDKGPVISCLYAMKYIRDNDLLPEDASIRMIIGADEEENLQCIQYYTAHAERLPDQTFIPDAYFPLVNSEKGLVDFDSAFHFVSPDHADAFVKRFTAGNARNIVPAYACCEIEPVAECRENVLSKLSAVPSLKIREDGKSILIEAHGRGAHAMAPENGENAAGLLLCGLKTSGVTFSMQPFIDAYTEKIGMEFNGEHLSCCWHDDISGVLTMNFGKMDLQDNIIQMKANVRYPISYTHDDLNASFVKNLTEAGFTYTEVLSMEPMYIPDDSDFIQTLMNAYREVTGDTEHMPFSIGGATYARFLPNSVSFGPLFPYETELAHEANECLSLESFAKMTEIYILALERLLSL